MYRIALCDDDRADRELIETLLKKILNKKNISFEVIQFKSAKALLEEIRKAGSWDLLLLDILMDGQNGIELANELRGMGEDADIIFITCSPDFALEGYHAWPVSYLLKPLKEDDFLKVLERCLKKISKDPAMIFNMKKGGQMEIHLSDIFYLEIFGDELVVHVLNNSYSCSGVLKEICSLLPEPQFFRCHRSYVINLSYVNRIHRYEYILTNGQAVPIAKGNWRDAKQRWVNYHTKGGT